MHGNLRAKVGTKDAFMLHERIDELISTNEYEHESITMQEKTNMKSLIIGNWLTRSSCRCF